MDKNKFPEISVIPEKVRNYFDMAKGVGAAVLHLVGDHIHYAVSPPNTEVHHGEQPEQQPSTRQS